MDGLPTSTRAAPWRLLHFGLLLAAILTITAPLFPPIELTPNRDSGVYLYAAQRILAGDAIYRDVWDHKPPLVYLPSLAAVASGRTLWGVWVLSVVSLGGAVWLLGSELRSRLGRVPAAIGVAAALVLLASTFKGNLPEEYGLAVQVLAILGYSRLVSNASSRPRLAGGVVGALGGVALLLKPTLVGVWIAMGILLLVHRESATRHRRLRAVWSAIGGGALVLAGSGLALMAAGLWRDFWTSVIDYNLVYAGGGDRWARWSDSLDRLGPFGLLALGGIGLVYVLALRAWQRRRAPSAARAVVGSGEILVALAMLDLPIEALLAAGSGRLYLQYLTPWIPAVAILAAYAGYTWVAPRLSARRAGWGLAVLLIGLVASAALTAVKIASRQAGAGQVRQAVERIERMTAPGKPILVWGAEAQVLALANRSAPSRYAYLYPLITVGYADAERMDRFAADLRAAPPEMILDTSATNPVVPPLDQAQRSVWVSSDSQYAVPRDLEAVMDWILANYRRVESVGAWGVYVPAGS